MMKIMKKVWWVKTTNNWNKTTWTNVLMLRHRGQKLKLDLPQKHNDIQLYNNGNKRKG